MTIADQLGTTYFQLSTVGVGALAVGIADIRQRINNLIGTIPGTDPLRPLFGCNAYKYTDATLSVCIPNVKKELFDSLSTWMPEITVDAIAHTIINAGQVLFTINYAVVDTDLTDSLTYQNGILSGGNTSNAIIVSALVPAPFSGGVYRVSFVVNGVNVTPPIPPSGFASASDMLLWINTNWANYGKWYVTATSLVLYLNNGLANTVSLTVTETFAVTLNVFIPVLSPGQNYIVDFTAGGVGAIPAFPTGTLSTVGALLLWAQTNWGAYGNWSVTAVSIDPETADFSSDFSGDFASLSETADYYLVFQSTNYTTATLTITNG